MGGPAGWVLALVGFVPLAIQLYALVLFSFFLRVNSRDRSGPSQVMFRKLWIGLGVAVVVNLVLVTVFPSALII